LEKLFGRETGENEEEYLDALAKPDGVVARMVL